VYLQILGLKNFLFALQAAETVDIMDEMRTVYNAFLPLFPYCYAYWKRYSDLERKKENWQRSLAILHRLIGFFSK
jgi:pre-mRNA-processing factor 39